MSSSARSIVVGVDTSIEAAKAARVATTLAERRGVDVHYCHVTKDIWWPPIETRPPRELEVNKRVLAERRDQLIASLSRTLDPGFEDKLEVEVGHLPWILQHRVNELGAGLVVLGGKHHGNLERMLRGADVLGLVRLCPVPVLVTVGLQEEFSRVLGALDYSDTTARTIQAVERWCAWYEADARFMTVVPEGPRFVDGSRAFAALHSEADAELRKLAAEAGDFCAQRTTTKVGDVAETLADEARLWPADLLVLGTHGKGFVDRMVLGSVAEELLIGLPTSLLVIPHGASMGLFES